MAIIAAREPYYITATTTDLVVRISSYVVVAPGDYQHTIEKSTNGGPAEELSIDVSQFIRPYFTQLPQPNPTNTSGANIGSFLEVDIEVNGVVESHNAVYGYRSPIDEAYYDHWQTVKRIHNGTDSQVSLPPGAYTVTWTTDDGQVATDNTSSISVPNTARVANTNLDLSTANTLSIATDLYTYKYDIVCPYMDATIGFINATGLWEYFDVNGKQDMDYSREMETYVPFSTGAKKMINVNGTVSVKFNTAWVDEEFRRVIQEFMMSETIIWAYGQSWGYMILNTNTIRRQTRISDKMINYSFNCELSDMIISPTTGEPTFVELVI